MSSAGNIFFDAGKALVAALDKHEQEGDPSKLLDRTDSEVKHEVATHSLRCTTQADQRGWGLPHAR